MDSVADGIAPAQLISVRGIIAQPNITERAVSAVVVFQVCQNLFGRHQRIRIERS